MAITQFMFLFFLSCPQWFNMKKKAKPRSKAKERKKMFLRAVKLIFLAFTFFAFEAGYFFKLFCFRCAPLLASCLGGDNYNPDTLVIPISSSKVDCDHYLYYLEKQDFLYKWRRSRNEVKTFMVISFNKFDFGWSIHTNTLSSPGSSEKGSIYIGFNIGESLLYLPTSSTVGLIPGISQRVLTLTCESRFII